MPFGKTQKYDLPMCISMLLFSQHYAFYKSICLIMCGQKDKIITGESIANEVGRTTFYTYFIEMEISLS